MRTNTVEQIVSILDLQHEYVVGVTDLFSSSTCSWWKKLYVTLLYNTVSCTNTRQHFIRGTSKKRLRSKLYIFNAFGMVGLYVVVGILNFVL